MATRKATPNGPVSRRVLVVVKRDMTAETPRVIWEHEKPLLQAIFGEDSVVDVDAATMDEGFTTKISPDLLVHNRRQDPIKRPSEANCIGYAFAGDTRAEYERLAGAYGKHPAQNMLTVEYVYGRFQEGRFERVVTPASFEDMPEGQLRELIVSFGFLPIVTKDSTPEEKRTEAEARANLARMPKADLLKLAEELSGEFA
jgi:hypothetical protein